MRRLLINFARIGDLVMLTPALRRLSADSELHLVCRPWGVDLLGEQGLTAGIHVLPHPNHGAFSEWLRGRPRTQLGNKLSQMGFDEVLTFGVERPVIAKWLDHHFPKAARRILQAEDAGYVPDSIGAALESAGYAGNYRAIPALKVSPAALAAARTRLGALGSRVVLVQAGSSSTHKLIRTKPNLRSLAPPQWASFIARLLASSEADAVVLLGSPLERRDAEGIAALVPTAQRGRVAVWAGAAPIREQPALAAAAHALISVDTGPAHIAAAVGCPLLMLFGPSIPERWCPRSDGPLERVIGKAPCGPCQNTPRMAACRANICLTRLPEESLFAGWRRLMAQPRPAHLKTDTGPTHEHGLRYHQATKYAPETINQHPGLDWSTRPASFKAYSSDAPVRMAAFLPHDPNPFTGEHPTNLATAPAGLTLAGLSRLIYATYGVTGLIPQQPTPTYLRASPSAGGLYPAEIYIVVRDFAGLAPGLYGYHPLKHALIPLWEDDGVHAALTQACYGNAQVAAAPVNLVVTGVFERSRWRYQERAYRRILLDSGHLLGNTLLVGPELDLRVGLTAAFCDDRLNELLRCDPAEEGALAVLCINAPGPSERPAWAALPSPLPAPGTDAGTGDTLAALHAASRSGLERPRLPALGDESAEALHTKHGWSAGVSLLGDGLAPSPLFGHLFTSICDRRSTRGYSDATIAIDQLARILAATYLPDEVRLHTQPSLVPDLLMTFIAIVGVDGIDDGVYYLAPQGLELRRIRADVSRQALGYLCLGQELGSGAAAVVFHAADLTLAVQRYGDRAYRYLHLDAGMLGERLNLAALAEGLGASGIGGFFDDHITELLGIPREQAVVYVTTLGNPA